ncbi:hypothetical protein JCM10207_000997 [Rhodosporidiobolus poonsookiae]
MSHAATSLVSVTAHLDQAPLYALDPPTASSPPTSTSAPPPPASNSKTILRGIVRPFSQDELRQLVLDYLCHGGYLDSAKAFASQLAEGDDSDARPAEASSAPPAAAVKTASTPATNGDAMDGVEATPPPELERFPRTSLADVASLKRERTATNGTNGKSVAFEAEDVLKDDEDEACGMLSQGEVRDIRLRRNIREAILNGRIPYAVDLLTEHFPSVLASPTSSSPATSASSSKLASLNSSKSCTPRSFFVASPPTVPASPSGTHSPSTPSFIPITGSSFGSHALSLSPDILALNLQTQTFIEHMRTAHASNAMSAPSTPTSTSSVANGHTPRHPSSLAVGAGGGNGDDGGSDAGMSASTSSLGSSSLLNVAIAQSQALREKVLLLPPGPDREAWEKECVEVCGLLAYKELANCPVRGYLAHSRREGLAEMVNAAILQQTHRTPLPLLALATRQATAFWSTLREMHVQFPPPPAGTSSKDKDKDGKGKPPKTYPYFDLHTFLAERPPAAPSPTFGANGGTMQTE